MNTDLFSVRLLLVAVFLVAGVAKLADLEGSRQAMMDFGLPARLANPSGLLLPLVELATAVTLIPVTSAAWGAVGALALLLLFIVVIVVILARGRTLDCHCFGQLHSEPVGWSTLVRNGVLVTAAGFLLWQRHDNPGSSLVEWTGNLTEFQLVGIVFALALVMVLAVQGWILINFMHQNGQLLLRMDELEAQLQAAGIAPRSTQPVVGLSVSTPDLAFELPLASGGTMTLNTLRAFGKPILLLFSDPNCSPCKALLPDISRWQQYAERLTLALISRGSLEANQAKAAEFVLVQQDREVAQVYQADSTPSAVPVRPDGTTGSPLAMGADAIKALESQFL